MSNSDKTHSASKCNKSKTDSSVFLSIQYENFSSLIIFWSDKLDFVHNWRITVLLMKKIGITPKPTCFKENISCSEKWTSKITKNQPNTRFVNQNQFYQKLKTHENMLISCLQQYIWYILIHLFSALEIFLIITMCIKRNDFFFNLQIIRSSIQQGCFSSLADMIIKYEIWDLLSTKL